MTLEVGGGLAFSPRPPRVFGCPFQFRFLLGGANGHEWPHCLPLQACEQDVQCGAGTCCAISLWLRGLRMCTPLGREGEECHPGSHKVLTDLLEAHGQGDRAGTGTIRRTKCFWRV